MSTLELLKEELYGKVYTENGDLAYRTTKNKNLDFYGIAGASRYDLSQVLDLFKEALKEDFDLAILNLFYLRDVRGGLGERDAFRVCFKYLCDEYPRVAKALFEYVIEYGRYDDLFVGLKTKVDKDLIELINDQLSKDIQSKQEKNTCSLLAKWMPSVNASNSETIHTALYLANRLNYSKKEYRQLLSFLRKDMIIENNLREKDYTFEYEYVPGKALYKYKKAFSRNDKERYSEFLNNVNDGLENMKVKTIYPYEIVKEVSTSFMSELEAKAAEARWNALERNASLENTIVVRDGSGSMYTNKGLPMYIATSMAILCSEQLNDEFKDSFITFSRNPELVTLPNSTLYEKLKTCYQHDDVANTDIQKVYDLIYNTSLKIKDPKDYIKKVIIISDMEFDYGTVNVPTYDSMEEKFKKANLPLPTIIYWNVNARSVHFASNINHPNVQFISGASTSVIDAIMKGKDLDATGLMIQTLKKYSKILESLRGIQYDRNKRKI